MTKKQINTYQDFIAKPEVSFWLPIIFTAISITLSFATLSNQQSLTDQRLESATAMTEQKLDQIISNQKEIIVWKNQFEERLGKSEKTNDVQDEKLLTVNLRLKNLDIK